MLDYFIKKFAELEKNHVTDERVWNDAIDSFYERLEAEDVRSNLESAVLDKRSWHLPIECKFRLLEKARGSGCDSFEFWQDYYKYKAAFLDPGDPDRPFSLRMANGEYL